MSGLGGTAEGCGRPALPEPKTAYPAVCKHRANMEDKTLWGV